MKVQVTVDVTDKQREAIMADLTGGKVHDKATPAMCKTFFGDKLQEAADELVFALDAMRESDEAA